MTGVRTSIRPVQRVGSRRLVPWWPVVLLGLLCVGCVDDDSEPEAVTQGEYRAQAEAFLAEAEAYAEDAAACAEAEGVEVVLTWDLGFFPPRDADQEQLAAFQRVVPACMETIYPPERTLSDDEVLEHYRLLLAARDCLSDAGYEPTQPTGIADFREAYRDDDQQPWSPYAGVADDPAAFRDAVEACPQPGRF